MEWPKTEISWSLQNKTECIFVKFILPEEKFLNIWVLSPCYSVLNRLSECIYFYIPYHKTLLHTLLLLVFKIVKSLQCILKHAESYSLSFLLCFSCIFHVVLFLFIYWYVKFGFLDYLTQKYLPFTMYMQYLDGYINIISLQQIPYFLCL